MSEEESFCIKNRQVSQDPWPREDLENFLKYFFDSWLADCPAFRRLSANENILPPSFPGSVAP